jgi:hypothetical protein
MPETFPALADTGPVLEFGIGTGARPSSSGAAEPLRLDGEDIEILTVMKERSWRS